MLSYLTEINLNHSLLAELDAGIKACLATLLIVMASICVKQVSLSLVFLYLLLATIMLGSNLRFLLKNMVSYSLIILLPYSFGILLSMLLAFIFSNPQYTSGLVINETLIRMVRIFFVWYIGSLYICSTPIQTILGMLQIVFSPLNRWGIPISKYLTIIMCIVIVLSESVSEFKDNVVEHARIIFKNKMLGFRTKITELGNLIVLFLANSLQKTETIQNLVDQTNPDDFLYTFKVSKNEIITLFSFAVFLTLFIFVTY